MNRAGCLAGWLVFACGVAAGPGVVPAAGAACPAFDVERTPLGVMGLAAGRRLTPADREAVLGGGVVPGVPVGVWPPQGPAPLRVGVIWFLRPEDPQAIELDVEGDGVPEIVDTRDEMFGYTYARPGQYGTVLRVRDRAGVVTTYPSPVTVVTPAAFEAELQGRWDTFRDAVRRGDLARALECVHSLRRDRVKAAVQELLRGDVERTLPPIRFVELRIVDAVFAPVRPPPRDAMPLGVRFRVDADGVWRLAAFADHGDGASP
jgi:hypothetical protein